MIGATGVSGGSHLSNLKFEMTDVLSDAGRYPGIKKVAGKSWEAELAKLIVSLVPGNPFDFQLWFRSRVAFCLSGNFWWFSSAMDPMTTKYDVGREQYFNLLLHFVDGTGQLQSLTREEWAQQHPDLPCKCISFYTGDPCRDHALPGGAPRVLHGFSLNVEVGSLLGSGMIDRSSVLPITFDPDVENKGGNPGP